MSAEFNPYREWLSIPVNELPANYYRLLGLALYESDPNVIEKAADRQMAFIRTFQTGPYSQQSQQLLNELAQARITLLDKQKKAQYDSQLRAAAYLTPPGAVGEMPSTPPPSAASLTPQPWSNNPQSSNASAQSHETPPRSASVPPVPNSRNKSETILAFLKKYWIAILIALVAVQFIICGTGLMALLLKPGKTEVVQNQDQQAQKEDDNAAPSEAQRLAEQYYNQSVELQENEDYDAALNKINVAVDLQPDNELYKAHQQALNRLIKLLGKTKNSSEPAESEAESETEPSVPSAVKTEKDSDLAPPAPVRSADAAPKGNVKPSTKKTISTAEAEARLKAQAEARFKAEQESKRAVKTINGVEFAFRWCPPGTFMMGSPTSEEGRYNNETQHKVTLTKGFWMLETEVTQKQWKAVMGSLPDCGFKGDNLPVECVSWGDCQEFCKKCAEFGFPVQLPTEAQWEYACRAGTTGAYAGNLDDMAWYYSNSGSKTHPVGTKKPNAWGLYDMYGNVWEWCQDWYGYYPSGSVTDPTGPSSGSNRVRRGGGWDYGAGYCRSASRGNYDPGNRYDYLGFRCVISGSSSIASIAATTQFESSADSSKEEHKADDRTAVQGDLGAGKNAGKRAVKTINGVEFAFRWCPAGTFMMGSPTSEDGRIDDETQHRVTLTKGFWMLETEVTQKQWKAVMGNNPSEFKGDNLPVESVSWYDCQEFCEKCKELGFPVQLPTEAQWEYACRAGTTGAYAGNLDEMAWYDNNIGSKTHPVGTKKPNAWGLYDMHGNVWEWCQDWYGDYPSGSVTDPTGPSSDYDRVLRGGGWGSLAGCCRSAYRGSGAPGGRDDHLGFRLVKGQ